MQLCIPKIRQGLIKPFWADGLMSVDSKTCFSHLGIATVPSLSFLKDICLEAKNDISFTSYLCTSFDACANNFEFFHGFCSKRDQYKSSCLIDG